MRAGPIAVLFLSLAASVPLVVPVTSAPAPIAVTPVSAEPLLGQWRVDLTATPAEGIKGRYYTDMVIESVQGDRIAGTFYGSRM
jgi:hypothetical protein